MNHLKNWKYRIANISSKLSRSVGVLSKLRYFIPSRVTASIYNASILPHLNYCNEILGKTYKIYIDKLYILQKQAIWMIKKSDFRNSSLLLLVKLKILSVFELLKLNISVFIVNFHKGILPVFFNNTVCLEQILYSIHLIIFVSPLPHQL